jgi:hypothetical protein
MYMIDPPEGWRYGFPKEVPNDVTYVIPWLIRNGYPKELIDSFGDNFVCRQWYEADTDREK